MVRGINKEGWVESITIFFNNTESGYNTIYSSESPTINSIFLERSEDSTQKNKQLKK